MRDGAGLFSLHTAWTRLAMAAGEVIVRRSLLMAQGAMTAAEATRMVAEKHAAFADSAERAGRAMAGGATAAGIAEAALTPYGRRARANAKRLGR